MHVRKISIEPHSPGIRPTVIEDWHIDLSTSRMTQDQKETQIMLHTMLLL
jgi:hypothetical protein